MSLPQSQADAVENPEKLFLQPVFRSAMLEPPTPAQSWRLSGVLLTAKSDSYIL
jgi:hypothetical protein